MNTLHVILYLAFVSFVACNSPEKHSVTDNGETVKSVQEFFEAYFDAIRAEGLTGELPYLDSTKEFFRVPPGFSSAISFDSVKTILLQNAPSFRLVNNRWQNLRVNAINDSLALYTGKLISEMTNLTDSSVTINLLETGVMRKQNSHWKLLNGQTCVASETP